MECILPMVQMSGQSIKLQIHQNLQTTTAHSTKSEKREANSGQNQVTVPTGNYLQSGQCHDKNNFKIVTTVKNIKLIVTCGNAFSEFADAHVEIPGKGKCLKVLRNNELLYSITSNTGGLSRLCEKTLEKCNRDKLMTICISVSQSLPSGVTMKMCVSSVLKAVEDFTAKYPNSFLMCIKLISTTPEILTAFKEEESTKSQKSGNMLSSFTKPIWSFFGGASSLSQANEVSSEGDIAPVILKMYALKKESILKALEDIQLLLNKEYMTRDLDIELDMFSNEDIEKIKQFNSNVEVCFNKETSRIYISGFISEICELQDKIMTLSRTLQQSRTAEQEAKHLQEKVCWKFLKDGIWMDFNFKVNARLEGAYQDNVKEVDVEVDGVYILFNMENKMLKLGNTDIRICRRNPADEIPDVWDDTDLEGKCREVPLHHDTQEYQEIKNDFVKTFTQTPDVQGFELWRIENPSLWRMYIAKRREMRRLKQFSDPESILYHGTNSDTCSKINADGFNRSYCGKNATIWGEGTYFATSAEYSAVDTYSVPDSVTGEKWMYRARVLTGEFCKGQNGIKEPPVKDSTKRLERYDSVANKLVKPDLFVIFHDNQAYPEYLIKFTLR
ncbi:protein mono-ADP-ribosyltransferase PARP14-like [Protopterus annectens]|uniref:protein mono-ADP-ribosyltransferase PARP14-like n=1 Tax=Protopterus annectens TaxID=7888 RepID=UPI001CFC04EF|nr:protein mono-ADP-ribosyltransferase PARP14-like [Protopterus annectens]